MASPAAAYAVVENVVERKSGPIVARVRKLRKRFKAPFMKKLLTYSKSAGPELSSFEKVMPLLTSVGKCVFLS